MPINASPLRYPGGKSQLTKYIIHLLDINHLHQCVYCEAFCGGAGVAVSLLLNKKVEKIILNDLDLAIYSIWYAILNETDRFIKRINETKITLEEWQVQRNIYFKHRGDKYYSFDLAWAAFFLNRTNRSGIIEGGPIGGKKQKSKYKIDCRFNRVKLIEKIIKISKLRDKIELYNLDGIEFIHKKLLYLPQNSFVFFDPPYFEQGKNLYKNALTLDYHKKLFINIKRLTSIYWIVTYDNVVPIREIYESCQGWQYSLHYTANVKRHETELIFKSDITVLDSYDKVVLKNI